MYEEILFQVIIDMSAAGFEPATQMINVLSTDKTINLMRRLKCYSNLYPGIYSVSLVDGGESYSLGGNDNIFSLKPNDVAFLEVDLLVKEENLSEGEVYDPTWEGLVLVRKAGLAVVLPPCELQKDKYETALQSTALAAGSYYSAAKASGSYYDTAKAAGSYYGDYDAAKVSLPSKKDIPAPERKDLDKSIFELLEGVPKRSRSWPPAQVAPAEESPQAEEERRKKKEQKEKKLFIQKAQEKIRTKEALWEEERRLWEKKERREDCYDFTPTLLASYSGINFTCQLDTNDSYSTISWRLLKHLNPSQKYEDSVVLRCKFYDPKDPEKNFSTPIEFFVRTEKDDYSPEKSASLGRIDIWSLGLKLDFQGETATFPNSEGRQEITLPFLSLSNYLGVCAEVDNEELLLKNFIRKVKYPKTLSNLLKDLIFNKTSNYHTFKLEDPVYIKYIGSDPNFTAILSRLYYKTVSRDGVVLLVPPWEKGVKITKEEKIFLNVLLLEVQLVIRENFLRELKK